MSQAMRSQAVHSQTISPGKEPLPMVGSSHALHTLKHSLAKVAASNCTVLITGETGTGKELAAEFIHRNSSRRARPFICINCAAIPDSLLESELFGHSRGAFTGANENYEGLLTSANGGTVFLDEIGDMSLFAQAKILRVLEKKEVCRIGATRAVHLDIRFIAATNQSLETMAARGTFRKDLYFRLNVAQIHVPSLRERRDDVPSLLEHYGREFYTKTDSSGATRKSLQFSEECMRFLLRYDWPGNIRELKNLVECLSIADLPSPIEREQLPHHFAAPAAVYGDFSRARAGASDNPERESLISALFWAKGNKSAAAKRLRWSRMTLYRKIAKHKIFSGTLNSLEQLESAELQV
jgi:transcriptional regulator with PAS, ATPase and Fis domain